MDEKIYSLSVSLADRLNRRLNKEGLEYTKLRLGIEMYLISAVRMPVIILAAALAGVLLEALVIFVSIGFLRRYASGLHAQSINMCTLTSLLALVAFPLFIKVTAFYLNSPAIAVTFLISLVLLYLYAPADTESRPIFYEKNRRKLKVKAMGACAALMLIALLLPSEALRLFITAGVVFEVISILPVTYKLLNRSLRNYEKYE